MHNQTLITLAGFLISTSGWFIWNFFLAGVYAEKPGPYFVKWSFTRSFGRMATWWLTGGLALAAVVVLELLVASIRRVYFPQDEDLMQEMERQHGVLDVMRSHAADDEAKAGLAADAAPSSGRATPAQGRGPAPDDDDDDEELSRQTTHSEASAELARFRFDVSPRSVATPPRRISRALDDYVPPPFTPADEKDEPQLGTASGPSGGAAPAARTDARQARRPWGSGDGQGGFVQSPTSIELTLPPPRRRGGGGGGGDGAGRSRGGRPADAAGPGVAR